MEFIKNKLKQTKYANLFFSNKFTALIVAYFVFFTISSAVFWFFPMRFAPDSETYIQGAQVLISDSGLSGGGFPSIRGVGLPLLLSMFFNVVGCTVLATKLSFFVLYTIFNFSVFYCMYKLKFFEGVKAWFSWIFLLFALALNPCILAFSHLVLTEFPTMTVFSVFISLYIMLTTSTKLNAPTILTIKAIATVSFTIFVYAVKQANFLLPLLFFVAAETVLMFKSNKKHILKHIVALFMTVVLCAVGLLGYINIWGNMLSDGAMEGENVGAFAGIFIVDGLRYFKPDKRGIINEPVTIQIMSSDFTTIEKSFVYEFTGSLLDSINYFATCVVKAPLKILESYSNNYKIITGTHHVLNITGDSRAYEPVNSSTEFFVTQEIGAWTQGFYNIAPDSDSLIMKLKNEGNQFNNNFNVNEYNDSTIRWTFFNIIYRQLAYFLFSFFTYFAPLILLLSVAMLVYGKIKGNISNTWVVNFIASFTITFFILFLAITAQSIDRYAFAVTVLCFAIALNSIHALTSFLLSFYKSKIKLKAKVAQTTADIN